MAKNAHKIQNGCLPVEFRAWLQDNLSLDYKCTNVVLRGLLSQNLVGGAIEPPFQSQAPQPHQVTSFWTLNVCAKFDFVSSISSPSQFHFSWQRIHRNGKSVPQKVKNVVGWHHESLTSVWKRFDVDLIYRLRVASQSAATGLPVTIGGAVTLIGNWPVDVLRPGVLSTM